MFGFGRLICTSAGQGKANQFKLLAAVGLLGGFVCWPRIRGGFGMAEKRWQKKDCN